MAELQLGNIKPAGDDKVVVDSKYVKGGYVVVQSQNELFPQTDDDKEASLKGIAGKNIIEGSLCYCQDTDKFYKYDGSNWIVTSLINQNAFSTIAVSDQNSVVANSITDTVTFAGSNVTITTDSANDKVTFSIANYAGSNSAGGSANKAEAIKIGSDYYNLSLTNNILTFTKINT